MDCKRVVVSWNPTSVKTENDKKMPQIYTADKHIVPRQQDTEQQPSGNKNTK